MVCPWDISSPVSDLCCISGEIPRVFSPRIPPKRRTPEKNPKDWSPMSSSSFWNVKVNYTTSEVEGFRLCSDLWGSSWWTRCCLMSSVCSVYHFLQLYGGFYQSILMKNMFCNLVKPVECEPQTVASSLVFAQEYFQLSSKPLNCLEPTRTFKGSPFLIFFMESLLFFNYYNSWALSEQKVPLTGYSAYVQMDYIINWYLLFANLFTHIITSLWLNNSVRWRWLT